MAEPVKGMLIDLVTQEHFVFQYNPPELTETMGEVWSEQKVFGATHPKLQYSGGGGRSWEFKLQFYLDDPSNDWDVLERVRWLESLMFPEYDSAGVVKRPPHAVQFEFGVLVSTVVVVKTCKTVFKQLFTADLLLPRMAEVSLKLDEKSDVGVPYTALRTAKYL